LACSSRHSASGSRRSSSSLTFNCSDAWRAALN
jgi:hypothetical protein